MIGTSPSSAQKGACSKLVSQYSFALLARLLDDFMPPGALDHTLFVLVMGSSRSHPVLCCITSIHTRFSWSDVVACAVMHPAVQSMPSRLFGSLA